MSTILYVSCMARPAHPNKEIEAVVAEAEASGWRVVISNGHSWAKLYCPFAERMGCIVPVWSTPKNAGNFAKMLRKKVAKCSHQEG
jgi:hypothetical protein